MNNGNLNQSAVDIDIDNLEKAAILLLSMGTEAAAKVMQKLSRDEVQRLISKMAGLSGVSSIEAKWTLQQFFNQYREQSGIGSASREYLEQTLNMALGQRLSRSLLDSLYGDAMSQDIQRLQWVPADVLARFFATNTPDAGGAARLPAAPDRLGRARCPAGVAPRQSAGPGRQPQLGQRACAGRTEADPGSLSRLRGRPVRRQGERGAPGGRHPQSLSG